MTEDEIIALAKSNPKSAFTHFVDDLTDQLLLTDSSDQNIYAAKILGFLSASHLPNELPDLVRSPMGNIHNFTTFLFGVLQLRTQFAFEAALEMPMQRISLAIDAKKEIEKLLVKIRKVVIQEVPESDKKAAILRKLSALENEVALDATTFDRVLDKGSRLTKALGEYVENLEPLANLVRKLKDILWESSEEATLLEGEEEQSLLEDKSD